MRRRKRHLRLPAQLAIAAAGICAACLPVRACFPNLPERPSSLDQPGVRVGNEWLDKAPLYEDSRLGSVSQIKKRTPSGELAIVGTQAAVFLPPRQGEPRVVAFRMPAGHAELLEWSDGGPRYLDRGGGGWQTGALIGEDGSRLWQPPSEWGMDDLAAGDLDGDGVPEFVAGYNGGGGVRLFDATGKSRWRQDDGNVWHVEIVDTDGDGKPEIVHSNAAGQVSVRDANGKLLRRVQAEDYFSEFSLVEWPRQRTGLVHTRDGLTSVLDFDGTVRASLQTPDTGSLSDAHGAIARFGGADHLVLAVSASTWDRTQLFVFDEGAVLRYWEVVPGNCVAVAAPEPNAFLFGCGSRVLRYSGRPSGSTETGSGGQQPTLQLVDRARTPQGK